VPRGFLKKDEDQGWELYDDLAEKTIQWEPSPDKSRKVTPSLQKEVSIP